MAVVTVYLQQCEVTVSVFLYVTPPLNCSRRSLLLLLC